MNHQSGWCIGRLLELHNITDDEQATRAGSHSPNTTAAKHM